MAPMLYANSPDSPDSPDSYYPDYTDGIDGVNGPYITSTLAHTMQSTSLDHAMQQSISNACLHSDLHNDTPTPILYPNSPTEETNGEIVAINSNDDWDSHLISTTARRV